MLTLDDAIAHYEGIAEYFRQNGEPDTANADLARYLKQLRWYETAIASGELVWKKEKKK